jgi:hypothetical protein
VTLRVDRLAAGMVGPANKANSSVRMSRMTVLAGVLFSQHQGGILTRATMLVPRSAVTTGPRDLGIEETPRLKDVAHACEARTRFGIVAGTTAKVVTSGPGGDPTGAARVCLRSDHRITRESGCATMSLTSPKMGRTLDLANVAGREDHSHL